MNVPARVFISATSGDLSSVRQLVKEALLSMDCHPVEQTNFPLPPTKTQTNSQRQLIRTRAQRTLEIPTYKPKIEANPIVGGKWKR